MTVYKLPTVTKVLWCIRIFLVFLILGVAVFFIRPSALPVKIIVLVIAGLAFSVCFVYLPFFFKSYRVEVRQKSITVRFGVIIHFKVIMPHKRTVYLEQFSFPADRLFGVSGLLIHATRGACPVLQLKEKDIEQIKEGVA